MSRKDTEEYIEIAEEGFDERIGKEIKEGRYAQAEKLWIIKDKLRR